MRLPVEEVSERYRDRLFAAAFHLTADPMDAEDAVQETLIRYYTAQKEFESEEHLRAWLFRVAINLAKNLGRSVWRRKTVALEEYEASLPFEAAWESDLFWAMTRMPKKNRAVIHLYYYEEYSVREIAAILGISESAVKQRLKRGRDYLKLTLKEEWNDDEP